LTSLSDVSLDTNVLSELIKPRPDRAIYRRVLDAPAGTLFASDITRYELRYGAFLPPEACFISSTDPLCS